MILKHENSALQCSGVTGRKAYLYEPIDHDSTVICRDVSLPMFEVWTKRGVPHLALLQVEKYDFLIVAALLQIQFIRLKLVQPTAINHDER